MKWITILASITCIFRVAYADKGRVYHFPTQETPAPETITPWFTGPLLTPTSATVPGGFVNIEPYLFYNINTGRYNDDWKVSSMPHFNNVIFSIYTYWGVNQWMDVQVIPQVVFNSTQNTSSMQLGDLPIALEFQLIHETPENNLPSLKFYIQETFPTGRYQKLKPDRLFTDAGGKGSFQTEVGFVVGRVIHFKDVYFMTARFNLAYSYWSSVAVKGLNSYGGERGTKGRVFPGSQYSYFLGFEFSLSRNWAFAFDAAGQYITKTRFSGKEGDNPLPGSVLGLNIPPQWQFSFAPAIEYNFNQSLGIIAGPWFTVAGRNSFRFISGVIALNYYGPITKKKKA